MFCSNCGNQLPEDTKFCNNCGAQLSANESPAAAPKVAQNAPEKATKKKTNIVVILAVVLCAFLLGKFVIAPSMMSDSGKDSTNGNQGGQSQQSTENTSGSVIDTNNPAYDSVFEGTYIVHFQPFFNMEMASFASKQDNGIICCSDYGYKDDVVKQWVETMYIPVSEATDTQKAELESTMRSQFAALESLSCCSVVYKMGTNYLTVTFTYTDVDQVANYGELYKAGILQTNTFISMSATEQALLGQGFVKK